MNLARNGIGDAGAQYLADSLKVNQVRGLFFILYAHVTMKITTDTHSTVS